MGDANAEQNAENVVRFEESTKGDFIKEYQDLILEHIPTNDGWAEAIAISSLSTACVKIRVLDNIGEVALNTGIIAVAKSSRGWKTPALRYCLYPLLEAMKEASANFERDYQLPSGFSPEGMVEYLDKMTSSGITVIDEISALFKLASGRGAGYSVQLMEFINKLLDGQVDPRYTIGRKLEKLKNPPYVCLIGATTPYIYSVLDYGIFSSGFGNRLLYLTYEPEKVLLDENDLFGNNQENLRIREERIKQYAKVLEKLSTREVLIRVPTNTEASKSIVDYRNRLEERADNEEKNGNTALANYVSKIEIYIFKLAGLHCVSRNINAITNVIDKKQFLDINKEDVEWATERIDKYISNFDSFITNWKVRPIEKAPVSYNLEYDLIVDTIKNNPDGIATNIEIANKLGWIPYDSKKKGLNEKYLNLLKSAIRLGRIEVIPKGELEKLPDEVLTRHSVNLSKKVKAVYRIPTMESKSP